MELSRRFVVQDRESGKFLICRQGEIGYTGWLREAVHFFDEQAALETALINCTDGFSIFEFWILERN